MNIPIYSMRLERETDIVAGRRRARIVAAALGLDQHDQARVATAVSELAREVLAHGSGLLTFAATATHGVDSLLIEVTEHPLAGTDEEKLPRKPSFTDDPGYLAAARLLDSIEFQDRGPELIVIAHKNLPPTTQPLTARRLDEIRRSLSAYDPNDLHEELRQQNHELTTALNELHERQDDLASLNRELEETNRGIVALYAELEEKALALKEAGESKDRFFSAVSHELRTPVNAISALSDMLKSHVDGVLSEEKRKQARLIGEAASSLSELVDDLLDLAKVERGKLDVVPETVDLHLLISSLRSLLRPLARPGVELLIEGAAEGVGTIHTDERKLAQILRNLLSNGLKFTESGHVRLEVLADGAEHDEIRFVVSDTGIGIEPDHLGRVFDEFFQERNRLQAHAKGSGLGLAISKGLAEALGGSLSATSEVGHGSTFTLMLPRSIGNPATTGSEIYRGLRALVVDDDEVFQIWLSSALSDLGFSLESAGTAMDAITALEQEVPDIVFLDINLPDKDGWFVLEAIKEMQLPCKVVIATGNNVRETEVFDQGAHSLFMKKDLDERRIRVAVEKTLGRISPLESVPR